MGKAARLRRHRGISPPERSAYALIWRECRWISDSREAESSSASATALTALPYARVLRYRNWAPPIISLSELQTEMGYLEQRLPFSTTLLDGGGLPIGTNGWKFIGALGVEGSDVMVCWCQNDEHEWRTLIWVLDRLREHGDDTDPDMDEYWKGFHDEVGKALLTMLGMLECVNVEMLPALDPPVKGHVAHGIPHYDVLVSQRDARRESPDKSRAVEWSHRWEVAGNFAHYTYGRIFDNAPEEKRVIHPVHGECVRVWRRSYIKGCGEFVPKVRIVGPCAK